MAFRNVELGTFKGPNVMDGQVIGGEGLGRLKEKLINVELGTFKGPKALDGEVIGGTTGEGL